MPYLREIMDCLSVHSPIRRVVVEKGAQLGYTEVILNWIGYIIANTPGIAMLVMPTMDTVKRNTRTRIDPMIEATPVLRERVPKSRANEPGNTQSSKRFRGGELVMTGANSAAPLRSTPVRYLCLDEVDAYPLDVDGEGDPVALAEQRTATFGEMGKVLMGSTPTIEDFSRIDAAYKAGDRRRYHVPCPHCAEMQIIEWAQIKWPEGQPRAAYMACMSCGGVIEEHQKALMLERGEWRAEVQGDGYTASFHISTLYSPFETWGEIAAEFLAVKSDPSRLKTWVNTKLGQTWRESEKPMEAEVIASRAEHFDEMLDDKVLCITAGVDVQDNRLEYEIVAWGPGEESWSLDAGVIDGSPASVEVWRDLDKALLEKWEHPRRGMISLSAACVDSGGHFSGQVVNFCSPRASRRIWAIKGASGQGKPPFPRVASKTKRERLPVYVIGVDGLKEAFDKRLGIETEGPGYVHFPEGRGLDWYKQLTSERLFVTYTKGRRHQEWRPKSGERNEARDCRVYAMAALEGLKMRGVWSALKADQFGRKRSLVARATIPEAQVVAPVAQSARAEPPRPVMRPPVQKQTNRPSFLDRRPSFFR